MCGSGRGCAPSGANSFFTIKQLCRTRLGKHSGSGRSLRRARSKRTFGTRAAGLRRREAAARSVLMDRFQLQGQPAAERTGWSSGPSRGEAAARTVLTDRFLLQGQPATERTGVHERPCGREERAFAGRNSGPHGPDGPILLQGQPAAERTGLRHKGAALRQGAAAGCRSLCDRATSVTNCQRTKLRLPIAVRPNHSEFGSQPAKVPLDCKELRAFAAGGCGPPMPAASKPSRSQLATGWTGLRCSGTALCAGRLRPADACGIETVSKPARNRVDGLAT